ncbi:isocitrate lyase/PEP mutase family protein [Arthrobacter sp. B2a2-09]|uniref:isocitrate lyase/PEP mutase family protein n=1 Tax=Arthrobacter sp. B2a2-09 TaxID=2952822 RepID=UPI0022CDA9FA|nr:isocitrate lyase/phosphoenolpyruvate mutase family protein [Arthrobacter sp. B2a2-09]MCZ9881878.1 isocitrate lyase/phosphoenolpyruvate mutase family protein [Arthrobacter sp. B2a2-09]
MPNPQQSQSHKAELFRSLHVPGKPLVLSNVWDSISARTVASAEGVRALATASHAISEMHGVRDGENLDLETVILWARIISTSVDLPVSIDFEKGYAPTAGGVARNVRRLIEETQAAGLNIEDTIDADATLYSLTEASDRISAARRGVEESEVPAVIAARVDALVVEPENWDGAIERANAYLLAGADLVFVRRLATEAQVARALNEIDGPLSVICNPSSVPLSRLAELGVARVSFGPAMMGLAQSALSSAAATVTALGEYPPALSFPV